MSTASVKRIFRDETDSSSFGSIGFISLASSGRLKGFIGPAVRHGKDDGRIAPVENREHAEFIGNAVREGIKRLEETSNTRLSLRVIATSGAIAFLDNEIRRSGAEIEAQIPVNETYSIIYIGYNSNSRRIDESTLNSFREKINETFSKTDNQKSMKELARDSAEFGLSAASAPSSSQSNKTRYQIKIIDSQQRLFSNSELDEISSLLSIFGYNRSDAISTVTNGSNIIGLVYNGAGNIVGISVTESRSIKLSNGDTINIAELTDAHISKESRGKSTYSRLLIEVLRNICSNRGDIQLIYAESNISSDSIIKTAAAHGRGFAGILPNHVEIKDSSGNSSPKNFAVTYLDRDGMSKTVERFDAESAIQEALRK